MTPASLVARLSPVTRIPLGAPVILIAMLAMIVIPLPPFALDVFFTFSISLALVVMLASIYSERPLDFSVFPTVLLLATLLRLALNVASTRVVLLSGHEGPDAAGRVIEAFGEFVVGGNYAVGFVVFAILVIINFVVVTKGAGRISEVSARFTLDAMPGKQMAIDADLNAGLLTQEEARQRRSEVTREADFYGAMDGASKFVRGDAIAGILILFINLIGGVAIGTAEHGLSFSAALSYYSLLTIGDGLAAQIPSLLLSSAAAMMVTRVSVAEDMGKQILGQLFATPKTLWVTAGALGLLGIMPGMPNVAFLSLAALAALAAWWCFYARAEPAAQGSEDVSDEPSPLPDVSWDDVVALDPLALEVGFRLISLVDVNQGGELLGRIKGVRKKRTSELGFLIPPVHIRDSAELAATHYRIRLLGVTIAEAEVHPNMELAIDGGGASGELTGHRVKDPVFGLDAVWIDSALKDQAQANGYMVFDAVTVVTTHLDRVISDYAHELLGHTEVQNILDRLGDRAPKLVEGFVPEKLSLGTLTKVMQNLLREGVPVLDSTTIVETLADHAAQSQDPDALTAQVRNALGRYIVQGINGLREELAVIVIDTTLDQLLHRHLGATHQGQATFDPDTLMRLERALREAAELRAQQSEPVVLLVADGLRGLLSQMARRVDPELRVIAVGELADSQRVKSVGRVGGAELTSTAKPEPTAA
ncbi:MAG: flagellar biosynthesis protein FlhA [Gammaproteobacteria bacterium]|nr:flagellar biosynthesis protein FlhA [Gammaproteobacteria bacterium]